MQKDLHEKPFDEGTLKKLDIFEAYTKQWLPTFIMNNFESDIYIFDLFAGPGYSVTGQEGSPIRILKQVNNQIGNIFSRNKKVCVLFNEYDKDKVEKLKKACESFCNNHAELKRAIVSKHVQYKILNTDVALLFPKVKTYLGKHPLLLFLDQNGIKFMSDTYLQPLLNAKKVDFLFYLSGSYFNRFVKALKLETSWFSLINIVLDVSGFISKNESCLKPTPNPITILLSVKVNTPLY